MICDVLLGRDEIATVSTGRRSTWASPTPGFTAWAACSRNATAGGRLSELQRPAAIIGVPVATRAFENPGLEYTFEPTREAAGMLQAPDNPEGLQTSADVLFRPIGAILVFAAHAGFVFLAVGAVG